MSQSLKAIDSKIAELKEKKKDLEKRQAQHLLKYLTTEIGDKFTAQLAACIIKDSWNHASKDKKERWQKSAETFRFSKPRRTRISDQKDRAVVDAV